MRTTTDLVAILKRDYARFPAEQTYEIYADDVLFVDPLNRFRGRERYRQMIGFMAGWFRQMRLDLHTIEAEERRILTRWTLSWLAPLPWQPRIRIDGWSELQVCEQGLIVAHIDDWDTPRLDVLRQHLGGAVTKPESK